MSGNKFEGPCAAFTIEKISVRNFAAMKLASLLLEGQTQAKENWNEEKWELLRTQVREQLAEQDLPDFQ